MTETEAKTKWCPMVRIARPTSAEVPRITGVNRGTNEYAIPTGSVSCIGSACMMFRWTDVVETDSGGYCGLAGKP